MSGLRPRRHRGDKQSTVRAVTSRVNYRVLVVLNLTYDVIAQNKNRKWFTVSGRSKQASKQASKQTYTRRVQWNHASVGLAQARPNQNRTSPLDGNTSTMECGRRELFYIPYRRSLQKSLELPLQPHMYTHQLLPIQGQYIHTRVWGSIMGTTPSA